MGSKRKLHVLHFCSKQRKLPSICLNYPAVQLVHYQRIHVSQTGHRIHDTTTWACKCTLDVFSLDNQMITISHQISRTPTFTTKIKFKFQVIKLKKKRITSEAYDWRLKCTCIAMAIPTSINPHTKLIISLSKLNWW